MRHLVPRRVVTVLVASLCASASASAASARTERVSVDDAGGQVNAGSGEPSVSGDGRYVAFVSEASNLVVDTNDSQDVFVHDRDTGKTERVSVDSAGEEANSHSFTASISADGRYVAFLSSASNLVPGDTNGWIDAFVHDRETGRTELVSVNSAGGQLNDRTEEVQVAADGRYLAFSTRASNVVAADTNGEWDVFVHDRETGATERVSVDSAGGQADRGSYGPSISADGRQVAFASAASDLVPGDSNGRDDVFVHDRATGDTERMSIDSAGGEANSGSFEVSISADGNHVAFASLASNLVHGDSNGRLDVFVHDRGTGNTQRASIDSAGGQLDANSSAPAISADGRQVAFQSDAASAVAGDTNGVTDVFVRDREIGRTERVSVDSAGRQANRESYGPLISADGGVVAFSSEATNLVPGDSNGMPDVFVHIRDGEQQPPPPETCTITGTPGDDVLTGTTGSDVICGLDGDDVIAGRSGNDILKGGEGADDLSGGAGDDRLEGDNGADKLSGSIGDDTLSGGADDDRLYGREGADTLNGDAGADLVWGSIGEDTLHGGASGDTLYGGEGADTLLGDDGDDSLHGDKGPDELVGGDGVDEVSYSSRTSPVAVTIGNRDAADDGEAGEGDDVEGSVEQVRGGHSDDRLVGDFGDNLLSGGAGDDELIGASGADELSGGDGADRLDAVWQDNESIDRLRCGGGLDVTLREPEDLVSSSCESR
jgi:Tol biopolymer transport system component